MIELSEILWHAGDCGVCMKGEANSPDRDDWTFDRDGVVAFARAIERLVRQRKNEVTEEPLDLTLFTTRTANCLAAEQVKTLRELSLWTENELLRTPNLGRRSIDEIKQVLAKYGLALSQVASRDMTVARLHPLELRLELLERRLSAIEAGVTPPQKSEKKIEETP